MATIIYRDTRPCALDFLAQEKAHREWIETRYDYDLNYRERVEIERRAKADFSPRHEINVPLAGYTVAMLRDVPVELPGSHAVVPVLDMERLGDKGLRDLAADLIAQPGLTLFEEDGMLLLAPLIRQIEVFEWKKGDADPARIEDGDNADIMDQFYTHERLRPYTAKNNIMAIRTEAGDGEMPVGIDRARCAIFGLGRMAYEGISDTLGDTRMMKRDLQRSALSQTFNLITANGIVDLVKIGPAHINEKIGLAYNSTDPLPWKTFAEYTQDTRGRANPEARFTVRDGAKKTLLAAGRRKITQGWKPESAEGLDTKLLLDDPDPVVIETGDFVSLTPLATPQTPPRCGDLLVFGLRDDLTLTPLAMTAAEREAFSHTRFKYSADIEVADARWTSRSGRIFVHLARDAFRFLVAMPVLMPTQMPTVSSTYMPGFRCFTYRVPVEKAQGHAPVFRGLTARMAKTIRSVPGLAKALFATLNECHAQVTRAKQSCASYKPGFDPTVCGDGYLPSGQTIVTPGFGIGAYTDLNPRIQETIGSFSGLIDAVGMVGVTAGRSQWSSSLKPTKRLLDVAREVFWDLPQNLLMKAQKSVAAEAEEICNGVQRGLDLFDQLGEDTQPEPAPIPAPVRRKLDI